MPPPDAINGAAPWYAKLLVWVLTNVAPTLIVLGVFIAVGTGWFPFPVLTAFLGVRAEVMLVNARLDAIDRRLDTAERNTATLTKIFEESLNAQRRICFNTSRTDEDRKKCYP